MGLSAGARSSCALPPALRPPRRVQRTLHQLRHPPPPPPSPSLGPTVGGIWARLAGTRLWPLQAAASDEPCERAATFSIGEFRKIVDWLHPRARAHAAPAHIRATTDGPISARWSYDPCQVDPEVVERLFRVAAPDGLRLATDGLQSILAVRALACAAARRGGCCRWAVPASIYHRHPLVMHDGAADAL